MWESTSHGFVHGATVSERSDLDRAVEALGTARHVVVLTGAGMSQDSGVPTFRDALTGLWARFDPMELATEDAFRQNPARVFGWYLWRRRLIERAVPHEGYRALVRLERLVDELLVVTQNVDGLHRRAGSSEIVELHGSLESFRCLDGAHPYPAEQLGALADREGEVEPPPCPSCGAPIRPGVVWYGELLPEAALERAWSAAQQCDALLLVGTSALVYPAAGLPSIVLSRGCPVVEVNPEPTPYSGHVMAWLAERASLALPALVDRLAAERKA